MTTLITGGTGLIDSRTAEPRPGCREVLVEVAATSICETDP
jgi:D-arabinose 1-dehydrogenase-like Zn-dependent alcohol dehydrogenase